MLSDGLLILKLFASGIVNFLQGNWPNGGGGTNFVKGGKMEKNEGAVINGAGYIDIIYLK